MGWSLCCSVVSLLALAAVDVLSNRAEPAYLSRFLDNTLLPRVIGPLIVGGAAVSFAFLFAVPVFLSGKIKPLLWLVPTGFVYWWFAMAFDWDGLIATGKPTQHRWRDLDAILWISKGGFVFAVEIFVFISVFTFLGHHDRMHTQQQALEFQRILETELTNDKVGLNK